MTLNPYPDEIKAATYELLKKCAFSITLNANDFFCFASGGSVEVDEENLDKLLEVYLKYGTVGVDAFMSLHEKMPPAEGDEKYDKTHPGFLAAKEFLKDYEIEYQ